MSAEDVAALDRLLDLADGELWDLIAGRAEPAGRPRCAPGVGACGRLDGTVDISDSCDQRATDRP